jgi:hypothetical protein
MTWKDEMDDEQLMSDEAVEEAVLRYLDETPAIVDGLAPSRDLWPGIEARIGARVLPLGRESIEVRRVRRRPAWLAMAAAAAVLVASTAGVTYVLTKRFVPPGSGAIATRVASTAPVTRDSAAAPTTQTTQAATAGGTQVASATTSSDDERGEAARHAAAERSGERRVDVAQHSTEPRTTQPSAASPATTLARYPVTGSDEARVTYDDEITRLHGVLEARRDQLDPATVATVEQNLRIIDNAIRQARAALVKDPHSQMLNEQLDRTLAKKTELLRAATLLPSA